MTFEDRRKHIKWNVCKKVPQDKEKIKTTKKQVVVKDLNNPNSFYSWLHNIYNIEHGELIGLNHWREYQNFCKDKGIEIK